MRLPKLICLKDTPPVRNKIFVETSTVGESFWIPFRTSLIKPKIYPTLAGELDALITEAPHAHLITCPVFGAPPAADKAQLLLIMSGDYRSKKEVAFLLIPAIGRKAFDLGGNLEKGKTNARLSRHSAEMFRSLKSPYVQVDRKLYDSWEPGDSS